MTKVNKLIVKCAVCGNESEQISVASVNYLLGTKEENDKLISSKQKCPKCGYESNDISKIDKNKNDEKKELLNKKIEESKYSICYSNGSLKPGNTKFTNIILVDDLIYKAVDGKVEYLENKKDKIDKVWDYVNCMQGNIRNETERIKKLPHTKDTARDEITFKINGEIFTLTSKISDEAGINFYNKIVNDIVELIK